ncbi:hypothetical protein [Erythrobacter sanguineus]|uniref:Acid phosphatase n=1 Tax=Erythrobacter sanguineus TaxID=198312 RepID=A0A1M7SFR6_9SPHN|nr:hypothetical protein [Erythrobacter sanguineus]SHN57319.1 hypothetical protein SAMN02745193_01613 [Erythrobacter sanguineus]
MMDRRIALLPVLALAGTSLSGCVAVAIPALAGSALVGSRIDAERPDNAAPAAAPARVVALVPPVRTPAASSAPPVTVAAAPAAESAAMAVASAPAAVPPTPLIEPALPMIAPASPRRQFGFAQFVRYGRGVAAVSAQANGPLSAMLADPIALDGQRRRCAGDDQPVAVIDLDPQGGVFIPPAKVVKNDGQALGLAVLREAGVQIAWVSDAPVSQIGGVRTALEQSGLDPRGEDIVSLRRDPEDRKQARKETLAATACIVAIAGDEKSDFDERFQYLRNPEAGAALETAIGDGWFLIEPVFSVTSPVDADGARQKGQFDQ